jgi:hypothetical protein
MTSPAIAFSSSFAAILTPCAAWISLYSTYAFYELKKSMKNMNSPICNTTKQHVQTINVSSSDQWVQVLLKFVTGFAVSNLVLLTIFKINL